MPFKSQSQRRKFYAMEARGEISTDTLNEWRAATPKGKLPERLGKKKSAGAGMAFLRPTAIGTAAGAVGGGLLGAAIPLPDDRSKPATMGDRWRSAKMWGTAGGSLGAMAGSWQGLRNVARGARQARSTGSAWTPWGDVLPKGAGPRPAWANAASTKAEAKSLWREMARRKHPDMRGSPEEMARINAEWDAFRLNPEFLKMKEAAAFIDELTKIADLTGIVLSQLARQKVAPPVTAGISDVEEAIAEKWRQFRTPGETLGYQPHRPF